MVFIAINTLCLFSHSAKHSLRFNAVVNQVTGQTRSKNSTHVIAVKSKFYLRFICFFFSGFIFSFSNSAYFCE